MKMTAANTISFEFIIEAVCCFGKYGWTKDYHHLGRRHMVASLADGVACAWRLDGIRRRDYFSAGLCIGLLVANHYADDLVQEAIPGNHAEGVLPKRFQGTLEWEVDPGCHRYTGGSLCRIRRNRVNDEGGFAVQPAQSISGKHRNVFFYCRYPRRDRGGIWMARVSAANIREKTERNQVRSDDRTHMVVLAYALNGLRFRP